MQSWLKAGIRNFKIIVKKCLQEEINSLSKKIEMKSIMSKKSEKYR